MRSTKKLAITADEFSKGDIGKVTKEVNSRLDVPTGKINDQDIADSIAVAKRLDAKGDFDQATPIYIFEFFFSFLAFSKQLISEFVFHVI